MPGWVQLYDLLAPSLGSAGWRWSANLPDFRSGWVVEIGPPTETGHSTFGGKADIASDRRLMVSTPPLLLAQEASAT